MYRKEMKATRHVEDLGKLSLADDVIHYQSQFYPSWSLPVKKLRLLGEYSNEDGPHAADHFLVLFDSSGEVFEAPVDAEGVVTVLGNLEERFDTSLKLELRFSTTFSSRVIWPHQRAGQPIFVVGKEKPGLVAKLRSMLGFGRAEFVVRPEIRSDIEQPEV